MVDKVNFINFIPHKSREKLSQTMSSIAFTHTYPLRQKMVRDLKVVFQPVGELEVDAIGQVLTTAPSLDIFDQYAVEIRAVRWKGTDILPVLEVAGMMEEIIEASVRHLARRMEKGLNQAA